MFQFVALACLLQSFATAAPPPKTNVEFELVTDKGLPPTVTQRWYKTMTDLGVTGLRIRVAQPADEPKITPAGDKKNPSYRVVGRIDARGTLSLPGGRFSTGDVAQISKWIKELGNNGVAGVTENKTAFGLTKEQLETVMADLARPVEFSTKGLKPNEAAGKLTRSLSIKTAVHDKVKRAIAEDDPVREELRGLSTGTALAALLRPAGAILQPTKPDGGEVQYLIAVAGDGEESWPIGWPTDKPPAKLAPKLFEFLNAEIDGIPAVEAIEAIQARLELPFLMDHNKIALHKIDLNKEVSVPSKRTYYSKVLEQSLYKAGLKYELRVDENDRPLLWITTLKQ